MFLPIVAMFESAGETPIVQLQVADRPTDRPSPEYSPDRSPQEKLTDSGVDQSTASKGNLTYRLTAMGAGVTGYDLSEVGNEGCPLIHHREKAVLAKESSFISNGSLSKDFHVATGSPIHLISRIHIAGNTCYYALSFTPEPGRHYTLAVGWRHRSFFDQTCSSAIIDDETNAAPTSLGKPPAFCEGPSQTFVFHSK